LTEKIKLLPCPFCGMKTTKTSEIDEYTDTNIVIGPNVCYSRDGDSSWVRCTCGGSAYSPEMWNKRVSIPRPARSNK